MKTKFISILMGLALIYGNNACAQNFTAGILGGFDKVRVHMTPLEPGALGQPYGCMNSFNINFFVSYKDQSIWEVSLEPGYIQKGGSEGAGRKGREELNYLQLPVLVDIYPIHKLYISIGPEFSYMVSAYATYPGYEAINIYSIFKDKCEISGLLGINYKITERIDFGVRYSKALTPYLKVSLSDLSGQYIGIGKMFNQYFQFIIKLRLIN